jgi:16S rRNA (uracil1498-N3)-methyltransferase
MSDRYFIDSPVDGSQARLVGSEAHHLAHVMRAGCGDEVTLFDGSGAEFRARVERIERSQIVLAVLERQLVDRELARALVLLVALPKADRARWLVEKATELGVSQLVPLVTQRSNDRQSPSALDKLRRAVVEASKQCGRNRLMQIADPIAHAEARPPAGALCLLAHPESGSSLTEALRRAPQSAVPVWLAVGPEGGFTPGEIDEALARSWQPVALGSRILRVETAAVAMAAAVALQLERPGA